MDLQQELATVLDQLAEAELETARWQARVEGLQAHRDALRRAIDQSRPRPESATLPDLRLLTRTAAIEQVLDGAPAPVSIRQILDALAGAGREGDSYSVVAATLQQLLNAGRIRRPGRGLYSAA